VALIMLLFINVVTAGKSTVEVTDLNVTGTMVTGVLTSVTSSGVPVVRLQDNESAIIPVTRQKKKQVLILDDISVFFIESEGN
jgi:hypothetical protein